MPFHFSYKDLSLTKARWLQWSVWIIFLSLSDTFLTYLYLQMIRRYMIFKDVGFFSWLCISNTTKVSFAMFCMWYAHISDYFYLFSLTYCTFPDFSVFVLFKASSAGLEPWLIELLTPAQCLPEAREYKYWIILCVSKSVFTQPWHLGSREGRAIDTGHGRPGLLAWVCSCTCGISLHQRFFLLLFTIF